MAAPKAQYHHYIPRFLLKKFAQDKIADDATDSSATNHEDQTLHVFDISTQEFYLGDVSTTCGAENLYYNVNDPDPMKIEKEFSKLESLTGTILARINAALDDRSPSIDILEKDIRTLFRFMNLSNKRSLQRRDEMENPYRENDFMFQRMFRASKDRGAASEPRKFWLETLLYLLETEHEIILADAEKSPENIVASTYKYLTERYALQIWKAADGCEFFLNERLVDFEGDTQSFLGTDMSNSAPQLMWMTTEDLNHLILPFRPDAAIVFCDESRCWESPFAESMHKLKIPYPENSLLKTAPHKDIVDIKVPSKKRRRKYWPATTAWRVNIGTLSREHHQIIASYSLAHAQSFVIVRRRSRLEKAKREFKAFSDKRVEVWQNQGYRFYQSTPRQVDSEDGNLPLSEQRISRVVEQHLSALDEMMNLMKNKPEPLERTKDNMWKSWLAVRALQTLNLEQSATASDGKAEPLELSTVHPALKAAFEANYPPQPLDFNNLIEIDFSRFFDHGLSEQMFAKLTRNISSKITELVHQQDLHAHGNNSATTSTLPLQDSLSAEGYNSEKTLLQNPCFQSMFRAAECFEVLQWMFESRQDILAKFIYELSVPLKDMQPRVVRMRSART